MRRKLFTLITALLLVLTTSVAPMKVAAQGLVEYALILVLAMVGVGPGESVEYYVVREVPPDNATASEHRYSTGGIFTITVTTVGDETGTHENEDCQQTVLAPVAMTAGLNTVNVSKDGAKLLINEEEVILEGVCLINATRVVFTLGELIKDGQDPVLPPGEPRLGLGNLARLQGYSVVRNGATVATSSTVADVPRSFLLHVVVDNTN